MRFLSEQNLVHQTENKLIALFNPCNLKLAIAKPFSPVWKATQANIEIIMRV